MSLQHEYHNWIIEDRRNIVAILEDLPSVKPPADHLCELLPRLQARYYSISSSPKVSQEYYLICVARLEKTNKASDVDSQSLCTIVESIIPLTRVTYTAELLFHQSPTRHSDYHCDDVVTVL